MDSEKVTPVPFFRPEIAEEEIEEGIVDQQAVAEAAIDEAERDESGSVAESAEGADFDQPARCSGDHPRLPRPQRRRTSDKRSRRNWRRCRRRFGLRGFLGGRPWKFLRDLSFRSGTPRS